MSSFKANCCFSLRIIIGEIVIKREPLDTFVDIHARKYLYPIFHDTADMITYFQSNYQTRLKLYVNFNNKKVCIKIIKGINWYDYKNSICLFAYLPLSFDFPGMISYFCRNDGNLSLEHLPNNGMWIFRDENLYHVQNEQQPQPLEIIKSLKYGSIECEDNEIEHCVVFTSLDYNIFPRYYRYTWKKLNN